MAYDWEGKGARKLVYRLYRQCNTKDIWLIWVPCKPVWLSRLNWPLLESRLKCCHSFATAFFMLKMSHNDRPAFSLAYLFSQEFGPLLFFFFFLVPSISKPPAQPVCSLVLGLLVVPPSLDSHPVIVQPYSPPCEPRRFAWLTQTSFGMLFSDMDFFWSGIACGQI